MGSREELKAQREKTSLALIDAALELAADTGYASLSLRSVARKAGIAPTSFYRHFRDIDEMGVAIIDKAEAVLEECLTQAVDTMQIYSMGDFSRMGTAESIRKVLLDPFADRMLACMDQNPRLLHLFFQERTGSSPALRNAANTVMKRLADMLCIPIETFFDKIGKSEEKKGDEKTARIRWVAEAMLLMVAAGAMEIIFFPDRKMEEIKTPLLGKLGFILLGSVGSRETRTGK